MNHLRPPILDIPQSMPTRWNNIMYPKPLFDLGLHAIVNRHLKRRWEADSWTWLQSLYLPQFCHPLLSQLSKLYFKWSTVQSVALWGSPWFQNQGEHGWFRVPPKLHVVCEHSEVACIICELPNNRVRRVGLQLHRWSISQRLIMCSSERQHFFWGTAGAERPTSVLIWEIQKNSAKALKHDAFFPFWSFKNKEAISLGLLPSTHEASHKSITTRFFHASCSQITNWEIRKMSKLSRLREKITGNTRFWGSCCTKHRNKTIVAASTSCGLIFCT
jgi:hypothetical protein